MGLNAKEFENRSALGKVRVSMLGTEANTTDSPIGVAPCDGEIVDFIVGHIIAGTDGVYIDWQLKKTTHGSVAVDVLATQGRITRAAGAAAFVDVKGKIAAITDCVRPVLSTTKSVRRVKKGDALIAYPTESAAQGYTVHPVACATVVIRPDI